MPIYEYRCLDCGKVFEIFQKITEEPLNTCRFCNGKVQKLISQCSFHLKGSGWYATDYKRKTEPIWESENLEKIVKKKAELREPKPEGTSTKAEE
ncbi:MAG: zinc ribbon domain-containing protein [Desulfobacterota bacterium]|nr:zinc ribbon domain-containing protein [Thermodesulfobacteriota bacterium]MDW8001382.1 zinc ribbon domain-containing protein [Deltaproteobacteria bacterium]